MKVAKLNSRQSGQVAAVTLTVDAANVGGLGFTHTQTLQSYRKRY